jgi:hypothetical protein
MAVDRFTRYKILRALWGRARALMAWLAGPYDQEARLRAQRWQQIQTAERQIRDGIIRGTGDPDSALRPPPDARRDPARAQWEAQRQQWEFQQRQWAELQQRQAQQQRRGR